MLRSMKSGLWRPCVLSAFLCARVTLAHYFPVGSSLSTPEGMRSVSMLQPGDLVHCRALDGSQKAVPLKSVKRGTLQGCAEIWLEGEPHFFARERALYSLSRKAFVRAGQLYTGERIALEEGRSVYVDAIASHACSVEAYHPVLSTPAGLDCIKSSLHSKNRSGFLNTLSTGRTILPERTAYTFRKANLCSPGSPTLVLRLSFPSWYGEPRRGGPLSPCGPLQVRSQLQQPIKPSNLLHSVLLLGLMNLVIPTPCETSCSTHAA